MFSRTIFSTFSSDPVGSVRFDDTAMNAIRAAHRRQWTTIATLVGLFLVGVGVYAYSQWSKGREDGIVNDYMQADRLFQAENETFMRAMQMPGSDLAKLGRPEHAASAEKFESFALRFPKHPLAWVANFRAASEFVESGRTDKATVLLESILPLTMNNVLIQVRVRRTLAGLYADKGAYPKAMAELDILEKMPENPALSENKLFKAKVAFLAGDKEKAGKILRELAASPEMSLGGDRSSVANEAALWLGHWGL